MIRLLYGAVCVRIPMMMLSGGMSASPSSGILTCTGFGSHSDSPTIRPLPAAFAFGAFLPHIPDTPFRICVGRNGFMRGLRDVAQPLRIAMSGRHPTDASGQCDRGGAGVPSS